MYKNGLTRNIQMKEMKHEIFNSSTIRKVGTDQQTRYRRKVIYSYGFMA